MAGRGRGGRGATGRGTPIEDVGDQGVASQTQQGVDCGVTSRSRRTQQGAGRGNPTPVVPKAHSGAGGREIASDVPVIPSQFAREVAAAMLEIERTRHEEIPGHWLSQIRKIFDNVRITEDDMKVSFASYQLVGEVNEWWESIKEAKGMDRGKANVVADALSRKVLGKLAEVASLAIREWRMMGEIGEFGVDLVDSTRRTTLYGLVAQPTLVNQVIEAQSIDEEAEAIRAKLVMGEEQPGWMLHSDQGLKFQGKLFVPMSCRHEDINYNSRGLV
ncbi:hypothetical protein Acr_23g0000650 [Actinidia rufa]|uniref:Uncharacterized protein n=1 Tax=Actinidia rufa TaxID=165716 RepID=A0A7J0GLL9_9ERIC|nr:hypothetical protein Acr_23g0000650 [Actinidia rufa]